MIEVLNKMAGRVSGVLVLLVFVVTTAHASDDLDVTMRMVTDDAELTESVVREIELPQPVITDRFEMPGLRDSIDVLDSTRELSDAVSEQTSDIQDLVDDDLLNTEDIFESPGDILDGTLDGTGDLLDGTGDVLDGVLGDNGGLLDGTGDVLDGTLDGAGNLLDATGDTLEQTTDTLLNGSGN